MNHFLTSEAVCIGHPDKVADQIADAILDECLSCDPEAKVACEVLVSQGLVILAGEITVNGVIAYSDVARRTITRAGYHDPTLGFSSQSCGILTSIHQQSPDIALGVNEDKKHNHPQGAGDQGIMTGFACDETPELMPLPLQLAQQIVEELKRLRETGTFPYLRPDGKCQVTVEYDNKGTPLRIDTIVISCQHSEEISHDEIDRDMRAMTKRILPHHFFDNNTHFYINPTGRFVLGGPAADTGLTGRKPMVDTYGGLARHGGGSFSGKDPSKVDRSAAYAARYLAKNVVASGMAKKCEVQIAYAIGVANPVSVNIDTYETSLVDEELLLNSLKSHFNFTPKGIIDYFQLKRPLYLSTSFGGHFGRNPVDFPWEREDLAPFLRDLF